MPRSRNSVAAAYLKGLDDWIEKRKSSRRDRNFVAFLALLPEVTAAVEAGYPVKTIWTNLREENRINVGYSVFLRYVNRRIRRPATERRDTTVKPPLPKVSSLPPALATRTSGISKPAGKPANAVAARTFRFNPSPEKKDYL